MNIENKTDWDKQVNDASSTSRGLEYDRESIRLDTGQCTI